MTEHDATIERLRKLADQLDAAKKASEETTKEIQQAQRTEAKTEQVLTALQKTAGSAAKQRGRKKRPAPRRKKPSARKARRTKRR